MIEGKQDIDPKHSPEYTNPKPKTVILPEEKEEEEELVKEIEDLKIADDDFYVHIDFIEGSTLRNGPSKINSLWLETKQIGSRDSEKLMNIIHNKEVNGIWKKFIKKDEMIEIMGDYSKRIKIFISIR